MKMNVNEIISLSAAGARKKAFVSLSYLILINSAKVMWFE